MGICGSESIVQNGYAVYLPAIAGLVGIVWETSPFSAEVVANELEYPRHRRFGRFGSQVLSILAKRGIPRAGSGRRQLDFPHDWRVSDLASADGLAEAVRE